MPLPKRVIEPVHVARGTLPEDFPLVSELEAVTNGTLANTVRQLSSLSRHAEDLFGELAKDAQQIYERSNSLQARIDRLAIKVTQLDSTVEEVSLQDIHMRKAFKSTVAFDQQVSRLCTRVRLMRWKIFARMLIKIVISTSTRCWFAFSLFVKYVRPRWSVYEIWFLLILLL